MLIVAREQTQAQRSHEMKNVLEALEKRRADARPEQEAMPVIEAQHARIEESTDAFNVVLLSIDVGPTRYKRILERLIREERPDLQGPVPNVASA